MAGLVPTLQYVKSFRTASAERYEVVIDFAKYPIGRRVILKNTSPKNNEDYANTDKIMAFDVVSEPTDLSNNSIPDVLNPEEPTMLLQPSAAVATRQLLFHRTNGQFKINSKSWKDVEKSNYQFSLFKPNRGDSRDLGAQELVGWMVPPGAHPLHRLQGALPQRQTTASARVGARKTSSMSARTRPSRCSPSSTVAAST